MFNIIILGAGNLGQYIASILSQKEYNVILLDKDPKRLEESSWNMDVGVRKGSGTNWQLLDDLLELSPSFFIALTNSDATNLTACSLARHLGYPKTIARVHDNRFLNRTRLDFAHIFDVDYFICPELLVANDILKYMLIPGSVALEHFAHGAVQLRTLIVPPKWKKDNCPLMELGLPRGIIVGLIRRDVMENQTHSQTKKKQVIFPHGKDCIKKGDEVTFIGETDPMMEVHQFLGIPQKKVESVVIAGGSLAALNLAQLLEKYDINVRIIDKDYGRCSFLADKLTKSSIIHHDATDIEFLRAEKMNSADVFVSCTNRDEVNLLSALLAKEIGCEDILVVLSNLSYLSLVSDLGFKHVVSPRVSAANHILSHILSETIAELVSFHDNQVEVMEVKVSMQSKVAGIPISELGPLLPKDLLIAMIQNRGRILIAHGDRIISPGDTVVLITNPKHVPEIEKIF